jgi:hypothetical protein
MNILEQKHLKKKLMHFVGKAAIYREGGLIKHVVIEKLNFDEAKAILTLTPQSTFGFSERLNSKFDVSVSFEFMSIEKNYIYALYVNWCLVTHSLAVEHLVCKAKNYQNINDLQNEYIRIRRRMFEVN